MSRGWTKASACRLHASLSCAVLCHIVSLRYFSSSLIRLAGLPCRDFLSLWSPSGDTGGPSIVLETGGVPCPVPLHFPHILYDLCPLPDPGVGPSVLVCDVEHTTFYFGRYGRQVVLCLFGECPCLCTICHS